MDRSSKRFSKSKSIASDSHILDADTNIIGNEKPYWWETLGDLTSKFLHTEMEETADHLNVDSRLNSRASEEWWNYLEKSDVTHNRRHSDVGYNREVSSRESIDAVKQFEKCISTSESEGEEKKKREKILLTRLLGNNRSYTNAFLNALKDTEATTVSRTLQKKRARSSDLRNDTSGRQTSERNSYENKEDKLNLSPTVNLIKLKPSIFKRRKGQEKEDENVFQDALTETEADILEDNTRKNFAMFKKKLLKHSINSRITDTDKTNEQVKRKKSQLQLLDSDADSSSNMSAILKAQQNVRELGSNVASDDNRAFQSDQSDTSNKIRKPKSNFLRRLQTNEEEDAFEDIILADEYSSFPNKNQKNNTRETKSVSPTMLSPSSSKESIERHMNDTAQKSAVMRSRSIRKSSQSPSLNKVNIAARQIQESIEQNAVFINELSDDSSIYEEYNKSFKRKSTFLRHLRNKRLTEKSFHEACREKDDSIGAKENITATQPENDRISIVHSTNSSLNGSEDQRRDLKFLKPKTRFYRQMRKSLNEGNPFVEVLEENDNIEAGKDNISTLTDRIPTEQNIDSSSEDSGKNQTENSIFLKTKSKFLSQVRNKRAKRNLFEEVTNKSIDTEKSNAVKEAAKKDVRISVERIDARVSQARESLTVRDKVQESNKSSWINSTNQDEQKSEDIFLRLSSSNDEINKSRKVSESDDSTSASRSVLQKAKVADSTPKKRISSKLKSKGNISEISKEHTTILSVDETNSNAAVLREVTSDDTNREQTLSISISKLLSTSNLDRETRSTRNSVRNRPEATTSDIANLPRRSLHSNNIKETDILDVGMKTNNISRTRSRSRKNSKNDSIASMVTDKNVTRTSAENYGSEEAVQAADDADIIPATQTVQRNSPLLRKSSRTTVNNKALSRTSIAHSPNSASVKENTTLSQRSSSGPRNSSAKVSIKDASLNTSKANKTKTPRMIEDFFKPKQSSAAKDKQTIDRRLVSCKVLADSKKMEKINEELEKIKNRERTAMRLNRTDKTKKKEPISNAKSHARPAVLKQIRTRKKLPDEPTKKTVNKAFLVNGKVYKPPKLQRPKHWATDHLYKFLWKRMEPKYKLAMRVLSEKFVQELAKVVTLIERRKKYDSYKDELNALMKEMARLQIIKTRNDFYNFCRDFMPYEFRVKVIPILLPGNKKTIPYNPEKLHTPLIDE